jgi:hypothetical protein
MDARRSLNQKRVLGWVLALPVGQLRMKSSRNLRGVRYMARETGRVVDNPAVDRARAA